jgi:hypothetical protein
MRRRMALTTGATAAILVLAATAAFGQVSGAGQTPLSAALGFVAKADRTGHLTYVADPHGADAGFIAMCSSYDSYVRSTTTDGFPRVRVTATCTDQDGHTVYLDASFVDRGEPGRNDSVCIEWSHTKPVATNHFIHDMGNLKAGNIQILNTGARMLSL